MSNQQSFSATKVRVPASYILINHRAVHVIGEVLEKLDSHQSALVTYAGVDDSSGRHDSYVVEFERPEIFDDISFPETFQYIEKLA